MNQLVPCNRYQSSPISCRDSKQGNIWSTISRAMLICFCAVFPTTGAVYCQQLTGGDVSIVHTTSGDIRGQEVGGSRYFQKIPYAAPPTGALRWRAPQPAPHWKRVRDATRPAPECMQAKAPTASAGMSEDCLYLNVMAPLGAGPESKKPIIVWIHGGGGTMGAGADYGPHRMVEQGDVIVVTINYRLGIFGYFGYPGLEGSGTFAMQDQIAALRWVRANARAFGGDPHNVTVAGESEGGISICGLLTSPSARGAFDKAILESGSCRTLYYDISLYQRHTYGRNQHTFVPVAKLQSNGVEFASDQAKVLKCYGKSTADMLNCLRDANPNDLLSSTGAETLAGGVGFGTPAYNTTILPEDPAQALKQGRFAHLPVLSGINRNEDRAAVVLNEFLAGIWLISAEDYGRLLKEAFHDRAPDVALRYPLSAYSSPAMAWSAVETDHTFVCPQLETDRDLASGRHHGPMSKRRQRAPVYAYEFADETSPAGVPFDPELTNIQPGAAHMDEVLYIFDMFELPRDWNQKQLRYPWFTPEQEDLATTMIHYWTQFARTGDPNAEGPPYWPHVESVDRPGSVLRLDITIRSGIGPVDTYSDHQCKLWASMP